MNLGFFLISSMKNCEPTFNRNYAMLMVPSALHNLTNENQQLILNAM
jgi:hypothetical protein